MSRSTNAINLLKRAGIDAKRSSESVSVLPETLCVATDPNDDLYCPGVDDPPSEDMITTLRQGWLEGESIKCVNRGTRDEPIPFVVDGRSRRKAVLSVNEERKAEGLDPIRVDIVFISPDDAYRVMLLANNRQERGPLFEAQRWAQHKRVVARRLGKATLSDAERREARKEFAELVSCHESTIANWEKMLENPPEVLAMIESGKISPTDAKEIAKSVPEAKRAEKAAEIAAKKSEPTSGSASNGSESKKSKKELREEVLGKKRPPSPKQIRVMAVRANHLGIEDRAALIERFKSDPTSLDLDELIDAAMADGFALMGRFITQEIGPGDMPQHLAKIAEAAN